jgi:hypothetical protein
VNREKELHVAARTADALVYVVGLAGVAAGGLLLRADRPAYAVIAWALTFCAGAALRLLAVLARAVAEILARTKATSDRVDRLGSDPRPYPAPPDADDRWGRLH